jgi:protein involved in polysaccharide export with SLBB domain/tetratricopeptide (TPR) repeat protein
MNKLVIALLTSLLLVLSQGHASAQSLEPSPGEAKKFYKQGLKYGQLKLYTEAAAAFELAILLKPDYEDAIFGLGTAYSDLGRWEDAIKAYRRLIQLNPKDDEAQERIREINAKLAEQQKAALTAKRSADKKPAPATQKITLNNNTQPNSVTAPTTKVVNKTSDTAQRQSAPPQLRPTATQPAKPGIDTKTVGTRPPERSLTSSAHVPAAAPAVLKSATNPRLPAFKPQLNLAAKITSERAAILTKGNISSRTLLVVENFEKAPPAVLKAPTKPRLPASKPKLNLAAKITSERAAILTTENFSSPTLLVAENFENAPGPPTITPALNTSEVAIYRIGVGDVLDVRLSDAPVDTPTSYTVSAGGLLDYPVLNEPVKVLGLTTQEVGEKLKSELKRMALSDNQKIDVAVRDYNSHAILVSGLVSEQGTKVLRREAIPLYVVLAEAQPLPDAGRVSIISNEGAKTKTVDLGSPDFTALIVRSGDVVVVHASPKLFFYIGGEVKEPGEKPFRQDLKLTQAILKAGGLSRESKVAELAREGVNGMLEVVAYRLIDIQSGKISDPTIQAGDRITIVR